MSIKIGDLYEWTDNEEKDSSVVVIILDNCPIYEHLKIKYKMKIVLVGNEAEKYFQIGETPCWTLDGFKKLE